MCLLTISGDPHYIYSPFGGDHRVLEFDHESAGGIHAARARPGLSGEVSAENIEKGVPFFSVQTAAIRRNVGTIGIQLSPDGFLSCSQPFAGCVID